MGWRRRRSTGSSAVAARLDQPAAADGPGDPTPEGRAVEAWRALIASATRAAEGRLEVRDGPWRSSGTAAVWPLSQVLHAAVAIAGLQPPPAPGPASPAPSGGAVVDALGATLARYEVDGAFAPFPGDRARYYDDNAWIGLALVQWSRRLALVGDTSGAESVLEQARGVLAVIAEGEAPGGGIRWRAGDASVNTCATAPAAELALRVHALTGDPEALELAGRCRRFLAAGLRRGDGLYADHVDGSGRVEPSIWSYNQGTPVGADVLWARVTGEEDALASAEVTAAAALDHFGNEGLWAQPPVFNAIFFRNLLALDGVRPDAGRMAALDAYLDRVWVEARDPRTGLCTGGGIGSYDRRPTIDQAGLAQLYAFRAWPRERWPEIT